MLDEILEQNIKNMAYHTQIANANKIKKNFLAHIG